jgi:hypothetical protein
MMAKVVSLLSLQKEMLVRVKTYNKCDFSDLTPQSFLQIEE